MYRFTIRMPPSTFLRRTAILKIWLRLWVPVTSQFLFLVQTFQSLSISLLRSAFPVSACRITPLPTTLRIKGLITEAIMSLLRSMSLALARTVSRL